MDRVWFVASELAARLRVLFARAALRLGVGEGSFLIPLAILVGVFTAVAAVLFHELILLIRWTVFTAPGQDFLHGPGLWLLVLAPAVGGLIVGVVSRLLGGSREGHGVVDVMESVARTRGFERPRTVLEKILTSAVTVGTGGSAGAEGPIVQIGAAVSGGVGALFRLARHQMPTLIGCGTAAGISAIFNAPIGGLLFTLEVILLDFSIRTITPIIVAAVVANVTMRAIVGWLNLHGHSEAAYITIFANPQLDFAGDALVNWPQLGNYALLGLLCGLMGVALTRAMQAGEAHSSRLTAGRQGLKVIRPAVGGLLLGLMGLAAVLLAGDSVGGRAGPFADYPMPAFYSDGYGVIESLLSSAFYTEYAAGPLLILLGGLCVVKVIATVLTLASGGSGGVIAPSLFLGATVGGAVGLLLRETGLFIDLRPEAYALIGMAAVLGAVVHAPLASILILVELTGDRRVLLPAALAAIISVGTARLLARDSLYTAALRRRGVRFGGTDPTLLDRLTVEQVTLEPAAVIGADEPFERVLELMYQLGVRDLVAVDERGGYAGMIMSEDINAAISHPESAPLMVVSELMRPGIPLVSHTDSLARAFDLFTQLDVAQLPVGIVDAEDELGRGGRVIGLISRAGLLRRYRQENET